MIYLDSAATTIVHKNVADAIYNSLVEDIGNPSSLHRLGLEAELKIRNAKKIVADLLKGERGSIIFTSGGTEANNLAVVGGALARRRYGNHIITTHLEHPSILEAFAHLQKQGFDISYISVDSKGYIDLEKLKASLREDTILVSIIHVNNEIGTIQPIDEATNIVKSHSKHIYMHVDAIQSFGKLKLYPKQTGIDLLTFSAHKIHGPKGIGGLYIGEGIMLHSLVHGGGQEGGLRSGTENLSGIIGLAEAVKFVTPYIKQDINPMYELKKILCESILDKVKDARINGPDILEGAPHILSMSFPGINAQTMLHALEQRDIYVSTGAACSSRTADISYVLKNIGLPRDIAKSAIRFSLSYMNTKDELFGIGEIVGEIVDELRPFIRR